MYQKWLEAFQHGGGHRQLHARGAGPARRTADHFHPREGPGSALRRGAVSSPGPQREAHADRPVPVHDHPRPARAPGGGNRAAAVHAGPGDRPSRSARGGAVRRDGGAAGVPPAVSRRHHRGAAGLRGRDPPRAPRFRLRRGRDRPAGGRSGAVLRVLQPPPGARDRPRRPSAREAAQHPSRGARWVRHGVAPDRLHHAPGVRSRH